MKKISFVMLFIFALMNTYAMAQTCWCVEYVKSRTGLGAGGNATQWDTHLENNGYQRVYTPQNRDIVVIKAESYSSYDCNNSPSTLSSITGVSKYCGHIGLVSRTEYDAYGNLVIYIIGTSQGQANTWSEYGCSNVSEMRYVVRSDRQPYVKFYRGYVR